MVVVRKIEGRPLRKVIVKIGLERIDMQEGITVELLLDSGATVSRSLTVDFIYFYFLSFILFFFAF